MAAAGKVLTGFSLPYVALYAESNGTITYSSGQKLARGVDMTITPESGGDDNIFYADNQSAESASGAFAGGTLSLTVDGLLDTAEKLVYGLPAASGDWYSYNDDQAVPYVGFGAIARYMSDGVTTYTAIVLPKVRFNALELSAATQEDEIDWQTQALEATIFRADDAKHNWKKISAPQASEADAEALIKTMFSIL